jgi:hypothetical protein
VGGGSKERFEDYKTRKKEILRALLQSNDDEIQDKYFRRSLERNNIDLDAIRDEEDDVDGGDIDAE